MKEITKVDKEVQLKQWEQMVQSRKESGLTISKWCKENNMNPKTYYYRLRKVREASFKETETHEIVQISDDTEQNLQKEKIEILWGNLKISVPDNFKRKTLQKILEVLK